MLAELERLILDPRSEDSTNRPLEIGGSDTNAGIYLAEHAYPRPEKKKLFAGSIDSHGEVAVNSGLYGNRTIPIGVWIAEEQGLAAATNLITNPSTEDGTTGFAALGGSASIASSVVQRKFGEKSIAVTTPATATRGIAFASVLTVTVSRTYLLGVWVYAPAGAAMQMNLIERTSGGSTVGTTSTTFTGTGRWQFVQATRAFGGTGARVMVEIVQTTATAQVFYVDGFMLQDVTGLTNPPVDYFDGDTPGCSWTGTVHASTSTRRAAGGKRFEQSILDLEMKIEKIADEGGTMLRILPSGDELRFDLRDAKIALDRTKIFNQARIAGAIELTAEPGARGAEYAGTDKDEDTLPVVIQTEAAGFVKGPIAAKGRLLIDDDATQDRQLVIWGVQSRYYDSSADAALFYEAEGRTALSGATVQTLTGGSGGGSNNSLRSGTLVDDWRALMSTQATSAGNHHRHIGSFRVIVALRDTTASHEFCWEWGEGDFKRRRRNPIARADTTETTVLDFGVVRLGKVSAGTQRWEGRLLARCRDEFDSSTNEVFIDWYALIPVGESAGHYENTYTPPDSDLVAYDTFDSHTLAATLIGKTPPLTEGSTWSESGDTDDFNVNTGYGGKIYATRAAVSDANLNTGQYARLGTGVRGLVTVQADVQLWQRPVSGANGRFGVFARYVDTNNWLMLVFDALAAATWISGTATWQLKLYKRVAGTVTALPLGLYFVNSPSSPGFIVQNILLQVDTAGRCAAVVRNGSENGPGVFLGGTPADSDLASGGALDDGGYGLYDAWISATGYTRYYKNFKVTVPPTDAAIYAGKHFEISAARARREFNTGDWNDVTPQGDLLWVPPAGRDKRTLRWIALASRSPFGGPNAVIDDTSAQMFITPQYIDVPEPS